MNSNQIPQWFIDALSSLFQARSTRMPDQAFLKKTLFNLPEPFSFKDQYEQELSTCPPFDIDRCYISDEPSSDIYHKVFLWKFQRPGATCWPLISLPEDLVDHPHPYFGLLKNFSFHIDPGSKNTFAALLIEPLGFIRFSRRLNRGDRAYLSVDNKAIPCFVYPCQEQGVNLSQERYISNAVTSAEIRIASRKPSDICLVFKVYYVGCEGSRLNPRRNVISFYGGVAEHMEIPDPLWVTMNSWGVERPVTFIPGEPRFPNSPETRQYIAKLKSTDNQGCAYYVGSSELRCTVNPFRPCPGCLDFEPKDGVK